MSSAFDALFDARSRWFDLGVFVAGMLLFGYALSEVIREGTTMSGLQLLAVPLIVVIAKFPMVLDNGDGSIEVGFDSGILMFLLCTLTPREAITLWSFGVIFTQLSADKRASAKVFNIGVGILSGGASALAILVVRGDSVGTPLELLAVAVAAASYFPWTSCCPRSRWRSRPRADPHAPAAAGQLLAVACFVPFDLLGYLGAVVLRSAPWWTLILLALPLATLLVATRAVTRGGENARRLTVLFDAAVRAQTLSDTRQVLDALIDDARRLLRIERSRSGSRRRAPTRSAPSCGTATTSTGSWRPASSGPAPR